MQSETYALNVPAEVAIGQSHPIPDLVDLAFHVSGTFNATLVIEGSIDGTTWFTLAKATGAALIPIEIQVNHVRVNTSAYVSGTPVVQLAARQARTI